MLLWNTLVLRHYGGDLQDVTRQGQTQGHESCKLHCFILIPILQYSHTHMRHITQGSEVIYVQPTWKRFWSLEIKIVMDDTMKMVKLDECNNEIIVGRQTMDRLYERPQQSRKILSMFIVSTLYLSSQYIVSAQWDISLIANGTHTKVNCEAFREGKYLGHAGIESNCVH